MYILSNFCSAYCFISFVLGALFMLTMLSIAAMGKIQEPMSNVHFYVARENDGALRIYIGKPIRCEGIFVSCREKGGRCLGRGSDLRKYGINENDYKDLKWEDEPVEVFITLND